MADGQTDEIKGRVASHCQSSVPVASFDPRAFSCELAVRNSETVHVPGWVDMGAIVLGEQPPVAGCSNVQSSPSYDAVFDEAKFRKYVGDDNAVAIKVVRCFLTDAPGRLAAIRAALSIGDAQKVARIAHLLKGSVSFFAAAAALDAAREVETIAMTGDVQGVADAGTTLGREIIRLTAALEAFLACTPSRTQP